MSEATTVMSQIRMFKHTKHGWVLGERQATTIRGWACPRWIRGIGKCFSSWVWATHVHSILLFWAVTWSAGLEVVRGWI